MAKQSANILNDLFTMKRENAFGEYSQFMMWLPNPDFVLTKANKTIEVYNELLSDPFVSGCLESRKSGVLKLEWDLDRGKTRSREIKLFQSLFDSFDLYGMISKMLDAVATGMQVFELEWAEINGWILPAKLHHRPAHWFVFGPDNDLRFRSKNAPFGEPIPLNKYLLVSRNATYANPYGEAVLSKCFWPATFKKGGLKFWVNFTEKFGMPWAVATAPRGTDQARLDELKKALDSMVQDGVLVTGDDINVKLEFAGQQSATLYDALLLYCKDDISMAFLGHTKAGQSTPGELGNNKSAATVREDIVLSDKRLIENAFNSLIKTTYSLNFANGAPPKFIMFEEDDIDIDLANRDKVLFDIGVRFTPKYMKEKYYFSDQEFTISQQPSQPASNLLGAPPSPTPDATPADNPSAGQAQVNQITDSGAPQFAQEVSPGQKIIDDQMQIIFEKSKEIIGNLTKPVKNYLNKKSDYKAAIDGLAAMYPKLNTDELIDKLTSIQFAAEIVGRYEVRADIK